MERIPYAEFEAPTGKFFSFKNAGPLYVSAKRGAEQRLTRVMFTDDDHFFVFERSWTRHVLRRSRDGASYIRVLYHGKSVTAATEALNDALNDAERDGWRIPLTALVSPEGRQYHCARGSHSQWRERELLEWVERITAERERDHKLQRTLGITCEREVSSGDLTRAKVAELCQTFITDVDFEVEDFQRQLDGILEPQELPSA